MNTSTLQANQVVPEMGYLLQPCRGGLYYNAVGKRQRLLSSAMTSCLFGNSPQMRGQTVSSWCMLSSSPRAQHGQPQTPHCQPSRCCQRCRKSRSTLQHPSEVREVRAAAIISACWLPAFDLCLQSVPTRCPTGPVTCAAATLQRRRQAPSCKPTFLHSWSAQLTCQEVAVKRDSVVRSTTDCKPVHMAPLKEVVSGHSHPALMPPPHVQVWLQQKRSVTRAGQWSDGHHAWS